VEMARDSRRLPSRGVDVVALRFIGFLNRGDVAVEGSLIDFSARAQNSAGFYGRCETCAIPCRARVTFPGNRRGGVRPAE
jgi:hypothetical protein